MLYKCKICGGSLEIKENDTIAVCEYCGTKQTLPKLDSEKKSSLLDRADYFRRNNEYDKASLIYEQILSDEKSDAEIYWLIVLCRYGIEYVEDPTSHSRIPTINRVQYNSILNDEDYLKALDLADSNQKQLYIEEANKINDIQKGILNISNKEEPFDIFICYKETDDNGRRTEDSVIAQDIYKELTSEGYKVFFSRITLEDKIGTAYEPYIFAALNSAKVMLAIGTRKEHFNAVWVKNEWSRYLALINKGDKKILVPCYKKMDVYDLPEEFSYLQAQDLNKLGYMQDLIRGIEKIIPKANIYNTNNVIRNTKVSDNVMYNVDNLVERTFMFLENGDFESAKEYSEKILDIDITNAKAYLAKLLIEFKAKNPDELSKTKQLLDNNDNYKKILKYGDDNIKQIISNCVDKIKDNLYLVIYNKIVERFNAAKTIDNYNNVIFLIGDIKDYKDIEKYKQQSLARIDELNLEKEKIAFKESIAAFENDGIQNHVTSFIDELKRNNVSQEIIDKYSNEAINYFYNKLSSLNASDNYIRKVDIYKNGLAYFHASKEYIDKCDNLINSYIENNAKKDFDECKNIKMYKSFVKNYSRYQSNINVSEFYKKANRKTRRFNFIITILVCIIMCCTLLLCNRVYKITNYNKGLNKYNNCNYIEALKYFNKAPRSYKDIDTLLDDTKEKIYENALEFYKNEDYLNSNLFFGIIMPYKDSYKYIVNHTLIAGKYYTIGLRSNGKVLVAGRNIDGQREVSDWSDMIAISAGSHHIVGLKSDGTVVAAGNNVYDQCNVSDWSDIIAISAGEYHSIGLKSDGTVVATGTNDLSQCSISNWSDIIAISAGSYHTVGLKSDGTVVATGDNYSKECVVNNWSDIVTVSAGHNYTVGLKSNGTVVAIGDNEFGQCNVSNWRDIIAISAGSHHIVGLKSDGTVVAAGNNVYDQCNVSDWSDIIAISAGSNHTVGLKFDGTVTAKGNNLYDECNAYYWNNIKK